MIPVAGRVAQVVSDRPDMPIGQMDREILPGKDFGELISGELAAAKAVVVIFVQIWLRWTLPRIRIDQVLYTCVKVLLPLSLITLVGTAANFSQARRVVSSSASQASAFAGSTSRAATSASPSCPSARPRMP